MKKIRTPKVILAEIEVLLNELSLEIGREATKPNYQEHHQEVSGTTKESYFGATGGIRFLISENFFKEPKSLVEVVNRLHQEGFTYRREVISTALLRFVRSRELTRLPSLRKNAKEKWNYVERR